MIHKFPSLVSYVCFLYFLICKVRPKKATWYNDKKHRTFKKLKIQISFCHLLARHLLTSHCAVSQALAVALINFRVELDQDSINWRPVQWTGPTDFFVWPAQCLNFCKWLEMENIYSTSPKCPPFPSGLLMGICMYGHRIRCLEPNVLSTLMALYAFFIVSSSNGHPPTPHPLASITFHSSNFSAQNCGFYIKS